MNASETPPPQPRPRRRKAPRASFGNARKLPSGRYQATYSGPDDQRHKGPHTFDTKRDAEGWLAVQRAAIISGTWSAQRQAEVVAEAASVLLGEYGEEWISLRTSPSGAPNRPRTTEEYRRLLRTTFGPIADVPLGALTAKQVRVWHREILNRGTVTTAARAYGLLRSICTTAVADGLIQSNPVQIRGAQNGRTGRRVEPPTPEELAVIVETIAPRYRAAVQVAAIGGLRFGELTELRRKDLVAMATGSGQHTYRLRVRRAVTRIDGQYVVGKPKSEAGIRAVVLPPFVAEALDQHLEQYVSPGPEALIFAARSGGHLAQSTLAKVWYPARNAAGRPDLPWHGLRHFAGTQATIAGLSLIEVQTRLGHSTVSAAMRYQHAVGRDAEIADALAGVMS